MFAPDRNRRLTAFLVALAVLVATPLAVVAADAFTDVPDTNVFHDDIAWLADAGVTKGCNPPDNTEFCPSDNVTREQMAAFMRRLAQNKVVDAATAETANHATTAGDAETLDGLGAAAYRSIAVADLDSYILGASATEETEANALTLTAPAAGIVIVTGSVYLLNYGAEGLFGVRPSVDGVMVEGVEGNAGFTFLQTNDVDSVAYTVAFPVDAGKHSIKQTITALDSAVQPTIGNFFYNANHFTATWHPEGSITLSPTGSGEGSPGGG